MRNLIRNLQAEDWAAGIIIGAVVISLVVITIVCSPS